jgi:hypothetical protein
MFSKMKNKKISNLLSCVFVENYHIFKWDFKWTTFLAYFSMFSPWWRLNHGPSDGSDFFG